MLCVMVLSSTEPVFHAAAALGSASTWWGFFGRKALVEHSTVGLKGFCATKKKRRVLRAKTLHVPGMIDTVLLLLLCFLFEILFLIITWRILSLIRCIDDELDNDMDPLSQL